MNLFPLAISILTFCERERKSCMMQVKKKRKKKYLLLAGISGWKEQAAPPPAVCLPSVCQLLFAD